MNPELSTTATCPERPPPAAFIKANYVPKESTPIPKKQETIEKETPSSLWTDIYIELVCNTFKPYNCDTFMAHTHIASAISAKLGQSAPPLTYLIVSTCDNVCWVCVAKSDLLKFVDSVTSWEGYDIPIGRITWNYKGGSNWMCLLEEYEKEKAKEKAENEKKEKEEKEKKEKEKEKA
ncbi:BgTH12-02476 [Blumeria graminis f. sp. triticale]|uniref:BgtA-20804 n=3 Tax=Blumeria graminis TaxID=34373 RepID=A0A9X9MGU3_BLUGR|nr:hypothetical protein BGT96224_A20804 [Blumeria graminis f. sp. tritici 96224]CAD6502237.1 BgTH12-02476 [Blumeria graminis f. sp. triticale]VDB86308.1 BgtA-20804 [Blumeria graminis f. sp. tritici]